MSLARIRVGIGKWVRNLDPWQKIGLLLLIVVLLYGSTIALDNLYLRDWLTGWVGPSPDLEVYRERAQGIIDGEIPYRDFYAESPPVINYLLVPPQLFGGEAWMYATYFTFFTFLTGAIIYLLLRRFDEHLAFISGVLFVLSPFAYLESTLGIQDESIVVFLFILTPLLLVIGRNREGSISLGVGIMTKMLSVMLAPILFLADRPFRKQLEILLYLLLTIFIISLPFLMICPTEFLNFPEYYFLEVEGSVMGGMSFWHFLEMGGFKISGEIGLAITIITFLIATYFVFKRRLPTWLGALVLVLTFFTFYPKIHLGYFLIPIGLLIIWASEDFWVFIRCLLVFVPLALATAFSENVLGTPSIDMPGGWMVGLMLSLIGMILLWDTLRVVMKKKNFIERGIDREVHLQDPS